MISNIHQSQDQTPPTLRRHFQAAPTTFHPRPWDQKTGQTKNKSVPFFIGSDADLALWDPNKNVTITNDILQQGCDYSPYEGLEVKGWSVHTIVRGKTVVKDGEVTGQKGDGKYLARQKSNLVTSTPV